MKKHIAILLALLLIGSVCLCGCNAEDGAEQVSVTMAKQEYTGDNIIELPRFVGEGEGVTALNAEIGEKLSYFTDGYEEHSGEETPWYEIKSYPVCDERYAQVVVTAIELPNYGTDGEVYSFNYDKKSGKSITLDDALAAGKTTADEEMATVAELYGEFAGEGDVLERVELPAFAYVNNELWIIARVYVANELASEHNRLFVYYVGDRSMLPYSGIDLLPPEVCEHLDPALYYDRLDSLTDAAG